MPFYKIAQNLTVFYRDRWPSNPHPVLLLHGLGADGSSWRFQTEVLGEAGYRPIAPDARGFGKSSYPKKFHRIETMAADMSKLLSHLDCGLTDVVGISLGGMLSLQLALDNPGLVRRLVLVNTAAWLLPDDVRTMLYYISRIFLVMTVGIERQAQLVAARIFPLPNQDFLRQELISQILTADPRAYRRTMLALLRFDVRDRLKTVKNPTLVITGENDTTILPRRQNLLAEGIPHARQVVVPGAGHAVTVEYPNQINELILEFLQNDQAPA